MGLNAANVNSGSMETAPNHPPLGTRRGYRRHQPENTALYPIVEQHLSSLREELRHNEASLPRFVLKEFEDYLRCGRLEHGFLRVKCNGCRHEHLFDSIPQAQATATTWLWQYNNERPHTGIGGITPKQKLALAA